MILRKEYMENKLLINLKKKSEGETIEFIGNGTIITTFFLYEKNGKNFDDIFDFILKDVENISIQLEKNDFGDESIITQIATGIKGMIEKEIGEIRKELLIEEQED